MFNNYNCIIRGKIKVPFLILLLFISSLTVSGQSCPNADFSLLNFDNWDAYTGANNGGGSGCCPGSGVASNRHTIITQTWADTNTCGGLIVPPPGFDVCARLGNPEAGSQSERLVYDFVVDADNPTLVFYYAVVLEVWLDTKPNASYFTYKIYDDSNNIINPDCGSLELWGEGGNPGFQTCYTMYHAATWKDWTIAGIDLSAYIGQHLRIEFTTSDCADGGHFGYAYITASCPKMAIDQSFCQGSNTLILTAPPGFHYLWSTGDTTQQITIINPSFGTQFTCQATASLGCGFNMNIMPLHTVFSPGFSYSIDSCSRVASFTGTTAITTDNNYLSHWDFGDGTFSTDRNPVHEFPGTGTFNVTLTVSTIGGCDSSIVLPVSFGQVPVAEFAAGDTCEGFPVIFNNTSQAPDGIASWFWKFGDNTPPNTTDWNPVHYFTSPGNYVVQLIVYNTKGCMDTISRQIKVYAIPKAEFTCKLPLCSGKSTTVFFTGSSTPLSVFNWDFGTATVLSGTGIGPYSVIWPNGGLYQISLEILDPICSSVSDTTMNILINSTPVANAGNDTTICMGHSFYLSGSGGSTYSWSPISTLVNPNVSNPLAHPLVNTSYVLTVTDNFCSSTDTVRVTIEELSPVVVTEDTVLCDNGTIQLNASGGTTYFWSPPQGLSAVNIPNPVASPDHTTVYSVTITDNTGCMATEQVSVTIAGAISAAFNVTKDSVCAGQNIIVYFNGGTVNPFATYTWDFDGGIVSFGSGIGPYAVNWMTGGNKHISLKVTESDCDSLIVTKTIRVRQSPNADAGLGDTICEGENVQLQASGGLIYAWYPGNSLTASNIANPVASPVTTTMYGVYIWEDGCISQDSVLIWVWPKPLINLTNDTSICAGDSIVLSAEGGGTYTWSPAAGLSSTSVANPVAHPMGTTTYSVTVTSDHQCVNSDNVTIAVNNRPASTFTVNDTTLCFGDDVTVTYFGGGTPGSNYTWDFNGATIISGSGPGPYVISWNNPGNYVLTLIVNDNDCYSPTTNVNVDVFKVNADIITYQDVQCYGDTNGTATVSTGGGTAPYQFLWNTLQTDSIINGLPAGTYYVTVTDNNGCTGNDSITITAPSAALNTITAFKDITCEYLCDGWITTSTTGGTSPYNLIWSSLPGVSDTALFDLCPGNYFLTITDDHGCQVLESFVLNFTTAIDASFQTDVITGPVPLTVNFTFTGEGANSVNWNFGDNTTSTDLNPSHIFTGPGIYDVILIINSLDPDFCADTNKIKISVEDTSYMEVPNVLTPNSDGYNDYFTIKSHYLENCNISIFDRWGKVVYEANNDNIRWDGRNKEGAELPQGTYFYVITAKGKDGTEYSSQGAITLLR